MNNSKSKRFILAPYTLWMLIFVIVPIGLVFYYAFTNNSGNFTFDNLKSIITFSDTLLISVKLAVEATLICLILAYPLAYGISKKKDHSQQMMILLIMLPMWMNFLIRTYAWMTILEGKGLINSALSSLNLPTLHMINTQGAVVLGMVYNFLPYMVLPIYTVMTKIDNSNIEAAKDLGANAYNVFRRIILPLSVPGIISGITMVFVPAASTFVISNLLGGGKTYLIGNAIEDYFLGNSGEINYNTGSMLSLVLMVLILLSMGIMNVFDKGNESSGGVIG